MRKYLRKAVFVFTLGLVSSVLSSSHLTASIGEPLAEEANHRSVKRILDTHLNDNTNLLNSSKDQNIVVFLGATGAGKSTLINFLTNHPLRLNGDEELELENPTDLSSLKIGNRGVSETFLPRGIPAEGFVFYDLAGFRDTRGTAINLVNASFIKHLIENARSTRLVFVAGQDEITASRGESFKNLLRITQSLFPNNTALDQSSLLVITKSIKRTSEDLIPYLEQRLEDRQRAALWLNPSRLSPMSKGTDTVQKVTILQKIRSLPSSVIRDVNIEAIYSEDVRRALTEIFALEMTRAKDETLNSAPTNFVSINDIDQARVYFSGTFEGDVLSKVNGSSLFCLLKPLSERGFVDEHAKLLATIRQTRDLKLSQLELQKEKIKRKEEQKRLRVEEDRRNQDLQKIAEQNRQLQQQMQQLRDDQRKAENAQRALKLDERLLRTLDGSKIIVSGTNDLIMTGINYSIHPAGNYGYLGGTNPNGTWWGDGVEIARYDHPGRRKDTSVSSTKPSFFWNFQKHPEGISIHPAGNYGYLGGTNPNGTWWGDGVEIARYDHPGRRKDTSVSSTKPSFFWNFQKHPEGISIHPAGNYGYLGGTNPNGTWWGDGVEIARYDHPGRRKDTSVSSTKPSFFWNFYPDVNQR